MCCEYSKRRGSVHCVFFYPSRVSPVRNDWLTEASDFSANGGAHMANKRRSLDVQLVAAHWLEIGSAPHAHDPG